MIDNIERIDPDSNYYDQINDSLCENRRPKCVTTSEYNEILKQYAPGISMINYNIRSFNAHIDEFLGIFDSVDSYPQILTLTETWFTGDFTEDLPGFTSFHSVRTDRRSGGVSVFIRSEYESKILSNYSYVNVNIEICSVEVKLGCNESFTILGIYRPHSGTIENFTSELLNVLNALNTHGKNVFLMGDFNINLFNESSNIENFKNDLYSFHFMPCITLPTRFSPNSNPSLLDNIWINTVQDFRCGVISIDITDHLPSFIVIKTVNKCKLNEKVKISFRLNTDSHRTKFKAAIENFDWSTIKSENIDVYVQKFTNTLDDLYCKNFPIKSKFISNKQILNPWVSPYINKLIHAKSDYFELYKLGVVSKTENNRYKNKVKSIIDAHKNVYFRKSFKENSNNIRETWKILNFLLSRGVKNVTIKNILHNGALVTDSGEIAEIFNIFFNSVATQLDDSLPTNDLNPLDFIPRNSHSMFLYPITKEECLKIIKKLKPKKTNKNKISDNIFKSIAPCIIETICDMVNTSFLVGKFPDLLKCAIITPIFKKADKQVVFNYRPISVLIFLSKIFEKCLFLRIFSFLKKFSIISSDQFGFTRGKSTEDALVALTDDLYGVLDSKQFSISVLIDYSKAFDTVNHSILLAKMECYGVRGPALKIFASYLENRRHQTKIGDKLSSEKTLNIGVPQGSILGPLLFLIYINDVKNISNEFRPILYADDTTIIFKDRNLPNLIHKCNTGLDLFQNWSICNRLTINTSKTNIMFVSNKSQTTPINIFLNNEPLDAVTTCKFLGVMVDNRLKFDEHVKYICNKISKSIGIFYKLSKFVPDSTLLQLYYSLIHPYLNYCSTVWGGTFQTHLDSLIKLQKKIIRIISKESFASHTTPLFLSLKILKFSDLYRYNIAIYYYKTKKYSTQIRNHNYNTRNKNKIIAPFHRLATTQHSVSYNGSTVWNSLPPAILSEPNLKSFKRKLKSYFIEQYVQ